MKNVLLAILIIAACVFLEWITTVGIIKIITMCFG